MGLRITMVRRPQVMALSQACRPGPCAPRSPAWTLSRQQCAESPPGCVSRGRRCWLRKRWCFRVPEVRVPHLGSSKLMSLKYPQTNQTTQSVPLCNVSFPFLSRRSMHSVKFILFTFDKCTQWCNHHNRDISSGTSHSGTAGQDRVPPLEGRLGVWL